jgi:hypothetical protein
MLADEFGLERSRSVALQRSGDGLTLIIRDLGPLEARRVLAAIRALRLV